MDSQWLINKTVIGSWKIQKKYCVYKAQNNSCVGCFWKAKYCNIGANETSYERPLWKASPIGEEQCLQIHTHIHIHILTNTPSSWKTAAPNLPARSLCIRQFERSKVALQVTQCQAIKSFIASSQFLKFHLEPLSTMSIFLLVFFFFLHGEKNKRAWRFLWGLS